MKNKLIHYAACGLEYVYIDVPVFQTRHGEVVAADLSVIERVTAREIVRRGIPIRGAEVQFLRKCLSMSLEKFGRFLGLSAPAILKWERDRTRRLAPINEVAVRALMAECLHIKLEGTLTALKGNAERPKRLCLKVA